MTYFLAPEADGADATAAVRPACREQAPARLVGPWGRHPETGEVRPSRPVANRAARRYFTGTRTLPDGDGNPPPAWLAEDGAEQDPAPAWLAGDDGDDFGALPDDFGEIEPDPRPRRLRQRSGVWASENRTTRRSFRRNPRRSDRRGPGRECPMFRRQRAMWHGPIPNAGQSLRTWRGAYRGWVLLPVRVDVVPVIWDRARRGEQSARWAAGVTYVSLDGDPRGVNWTVATGRPHGAPLPGEVVAPVVIRASSTRIDDDAGARFQHFRDVILSVRPSIAPPRPPPSRGLGACAALL